MLATHSWTSLAYWRVVSPPRSPPTGEQELTRFASCQAQVLVDRLTGLIGQLKPYWSARLLLTDGRPVHRVAARGDITVIAGSGHMTPMEQPDAVTEALRVWLHRSD